MPDFKLSESFVCELTKSQPRLYGFIFKCLSDQQPARRNANGLEITLPVDKPCEHAYPFKIN